MEGECHGEDIFGMGGVVAQLAQSLLRSHKAYGFHPALSTCEYGFIPLYSMFTSLPSVYYLVVQFCHRITIQYPPLSVCCKASGGFRSSHRVKPLCHTHLTNTSHFRISNFLDLFYFLDFPFNQKHVGQEFPKTLMLLNQR